MPGWLQAQGGSRGQSFSLWAALTPRLCFPGMQFNPRQGECDGLTGRAQGWDPISSVSAIIPSSSAGFPSLLSLQPGGIPDVDGVGLMAQPGSASRSRRSQGKRKRLLGEVPCQRGRLCCSLLIIPSWKSISWHRQPSNLLVAMETARGAGGEKYSLVRKSPNFVLRHF